MAGLLSDNPTLEQVFKVSGAPTHTFVEPQRYPELLSNLRTPGRGLVIEGPSGIGKTTAIRKALASVGLGNKTTELSARRQADREYIEVLPEASGAGIVLVDDFHKLPPQTKSALADYLKILADAESLTDKVIVLGINQAGKTLIDFAPDLVNRIDVIRFETEPHEKVETLLRKGEYALNIRLNVLSDIAAAANGSFYVAQMLAREVCLAANVTTKQECTIITDTSFEAIRASVWDRLALVFSDRTKRFCEGSRLRKVGRAPYLHILWWLATCDSWTLDLRDAIRKFPSLRGSVSQVLDKGFLRNLVEENSQIRDVLHYDDVSQQLSIEDPQYVFFLRGVPWRQFARDIGFVSVEFERRYDFALSFAGADRDVAETLFEQLSASEVEVFYDKNEEHRILATDIEEYLRPIYQSEAQYVVAIMGPEYPGRIWTRFESEAFKQRLKDGAVVPVSFVDSKPTTFDPTQNLGCVVLDRSIGLEDQVRQLSTTLLKKLEESKISSET